jgi:linoleoyl-CoA desaturase
MRCEKQLSQSFAREVKASANEYFERNRLSRHANEAMITKTVVLVALYLGSYGPDHQRRPAAAVDVVLLLRDGYRHGRDRLLGHSRCPARRLFGQPARQRLIGCLFDTLGANGYVWKITHNGIHHTYTNIRGYDEDLEVSPLIRLSPHTPFKPIHRFQHLYAFVAYGTATVFWVFVKDYKYFLKRDLGPYRDKKHPPFEWLFLIISKASYYLAMIVLPLLVLDITWWQFLIGFLTLHLTAGLILGVIFQLAHVVEATVHLPEHEAGALKGTWMLYQMRTTNDFARGNRLLSWYVGGLNYQIEHHLLPRVCHVHDPQLSPIVERLASKHGVPYHSCPTLWQAIRSYYRVLKRLGDPGYEPPARNQVVWVGPATG